MGKQIRVRPADPNDYESVLAIGPDFKAAVHPVTIMYHSYLSDPQAHPFVTEIDGEVVRLLFYSIFCLACCIMIYVRYNWSPSMINHNLRCIKRTILKKEQS